MFILQRRSDGKLYRGRDASPWDDSRWSSKPSDAYVYRTRQAAGQGLRHASWNKPANSYIIVPVSLKLPKADGVTMVSID